MSVSHSEPPQRLLFGPGPTMVEPQVYEAMSKPIVGHLDPYFLGLIQNVRTGLRRLFGTENEMTLAISGTGSAGMQTAVANFVEPGSKLAVFANGFFCDRLSEMGRRQGAQVVRLEKPWGQIFTAEEAEDFLERERPQSVAFVHAETSTGALQPVSMITQAAHRAGALVIADTVTSLGATPINVDEAGIDVAYSCSQKGLSCPPGLAPITVSSRAMERLRARTAPMAEWYLDLRLLADYYNPPHRYHHTAPISLFYGLQAALRAIDGEGIETRFARHACAHARFVQGIQGLGLEMLVDPAARIPHLNTVRVPARVDDLRVRKALLERHGVEIAGGLGPLAGKIFRIGVMGPLATETSVAGFVNAFRDALAN